MDCWFSLITVVFANSQTQAEDWPIRNSIGTFRERHCADLHMHAQWLVCGATQTRAWCVRGFYRARRLFVHRRYGKGLRIDLIRCFGRQAMRLCDCLHSR